MLGWRTQSSLQNLLAWCWESQEDVHGEIKVSLVECVTDFTGFRIRMNASILSVKRSIVF